MIDLNRLANNYLNMGVRGVTVYSDSKPYVFGVRPGILAFFTPVMELVIAGFIIFSLYAISRPCGHGFEYGSICSTNSRGLLIAMLIVCIIVGIVIIIYIINIARTSYVFSLSEKADIKVTHFSLFSPSEHYYPLGSRRAVSVESDATTKNGNPITYKVCLGCDYDTIVIRHLSEESSQWLQSFLTTVFCIDKEYLVQRRKPASSLQVNGHITASALKPVKRTTSSLLSQVSENDIPVIQIDACDEITDVKADEHQSEAKTGDDVTGNDNEKEPAVFDVPEISDVILDNSSLGDSELQNNIESEGSGTSLFDSGSSLFDKNDEKPTFDSDSSLFDKKDDPFSKPVFGDTDKKDDPFSKPLFGDQDKKDDPFSKPVFSSSAFDRKPDEFWDSLNK